MFAMTIGKKLQTRIFVCTCVYSQFFIVMVTITLCFTIQPLNAIQKNQLYEIIDKSVWRADLKRWNFYQCMKYISLDITREKSNFERTQITEKKILNITSELKLFMKCLLYRVKFIFLLKIWCEKENALIEKEDKKRNFST